MRDKNLALRGQVLVTAGPGAGLTKGPQIGRRHLLAASAALLLPTPLIARQPEPWRLVAQDYFAPYNYVSDGKFIGVDIDILNAAARDMGVVIDFVPLPWRRALMAFQSGDTDGMFQLAPTPQRFRDWSMVGPLRSTRLVFAVMADSGIADFDDVPGLAGRTIGVVNGFTYTPDFNAGRHFIREGSVDDETGLRKMLMGRVQMVVGGQMNLRFAIDSLGVRDAIRILPTPLDVQPRYVGFLRDPERLEKAAMLQHALARMQRDGRIDAILQRNLAE